MKFRFLSISFFLVCLLQGPTVYSQTLQRFAYSQPKMGTQFNLIFYAADSLLADKVAQAAFSKIDSLNHQLSDYDLDSELSLLSASSGNSQWVKLSPELWEVLNTAIYYAKLSEGCFDPTIGPLSKLWRRAIRRKTFPDKEKLEWAHSLVDYRNVLLDSISHSALLQKPGMRLDLGGIAKGYTVDQLIQLISGHGIERVLVDGGGDIRVTKAPPGKLGWAIEKPGVDSSGQLTSEIFYLENGAIASSGARFKYLEWKGKRYSHIIDPRDGLGVSQRRLLTVQAATATEADVLASVFSIWEISNARHVMKAKPFLSIQYLVMGANGNWKKTEK